MTAAFETIMLEQQDGVATLTLNRPEKYNAVNMAMHNELQSALRRLERDRGLRALVFTGAGKAFCAGQDLTDFGKQREGYRVDELIRATFNRFVLGLRELPVPVIAAVNGVAAGAGASLALACDLRVCARSASFMQAFVRIGLVPDTGSTWFLPHLVGVSRALELAWTGDAVSAEHAVEIGMANRVVEDERLASETQALAQQLAQGPTRAHALTKRAIYRAATTPLADALEYEAQLQQAAIKTADHAEGVQAFLDKRTPAFVGA